MTQMKQEQEIMGMVTDIQRFSVHDGPGIRTTVFLKGCNMDCAWCHNPETISFEPEMIVDESKCIGCWKCDEGCYSGAKRWVGTQKTVGQVLKEVLLDQPYYGEDGGVTISGGEPTCQPVFTRELLKACKEAGLSCGVESNLSVDWAILKEIASLCDVFMCDLKIWDSDLHKKYTRVGNERIIENLKKLDTIGIPIILRTPIIPGINDNAEQIKPIAQLAATLKNLKYYELLPYHPLGLSKKLAGKEQKPRFEKPPKETMSALAQLAKEQKLPVRVASVNIFEEE